MDPVEMRDEEVLELRDKTSHIVHALDPELHFHDFRVLKENEQKNLIFDLEKRYGKENIRIRSLGI